MRVKRHELTFTGIDGEGTGKGRDHRYVLLGIGDQARTWPEGVHDITEIFAFLYGQYEQNPEAVYCGFFLGYDFNMWLRLLPRERAAMLLTPEGRAKRKRRTGYDHLPPWPVQYHGWEFDMLAYKRFKLRPRGAKGWLYVNDTGPFFQTSLLNVINPAKWPDPVVSDSEYETLQRGKQRRSDAVLDDEMVRYNALENEVLARALRRLNTGFTAAGVHLDKRQWFGPGQSAQKWIALGGKLDTATEAVRGYPRALHDALTASYYGGWFELAAHGIIPGDTHEYDINNAYVAVIASLPCSCGGWRHGVGAPGRTVALRLVHASVRGSDPVLGPLPYRGRDGRVLRPLETSGWYWEHEVRAARAAGLVQEVTYREYWEYAGCGHDPPLRGLAGLYDERLRVGKDSPQGKAYKLLYVSVYGKLAQSVGNPRYGNALYASLITSGCRTRILRAIASHPRKSADVVMVATDAVYFRTPHDGLPVSVRLGDWSASAHADMCLFKPGVYWDDATRQRIARGESVAFKARGISAAAFASAVGRVDGLFGAWTPEGSREWPEVTFTSGFAQTSVIQALAWSASDPRRYKRLAGKVEESKTLTQSSDPEIKRDPGSLYRDAGVWRTRPWRGRGWPESVAYDRAFGWTESAEFADYMSPDGPVLMQFRDVLMDGLVNQFGR